MWASIAWHTIKDCVHKTSFLVAVIIVFICMILTQLFISISPGSEQEFLTDIIYQSIKFISSIFLIFVVADLFIKERNNQTLYFYFVNPITNFSFMMGKFLGVVAIMGLLVFSVFILLELFLFILLKNVQIRIFWIFFDLWGQMIVLSAYGLFGACFLSRGTNAIFVISVQLCAHFSKMIHHIIDDHIDFNWFFNQSMSEKIFSILPSYIKENPMALFFPDFQSFDPLTMFVIDLPIHASLAMKQFGSYLIYVFVLFIVSMFTFKRLFRWKE